MPHESPWPVLLALALSLVFVMLLLQQYGAAGVMGAVCVLTLLGWHSNEPQPADAAAATRRIGRPASWWGMLVLIAAEATLFVAFIGTYFYLRFKTTPWPPDRLPEPKVVLPLVLVAILLTSSAAMQLASNAAQGGRLAATRVWVVIALVVQSGYLAYEVHDFADQLGTFGIGRDAYSSIYYTLLGADHAHVALGILFNLWLLGALARGLTTYRVNATQAIAWYWHAVNALTLVVTATLLSGAVG
jgi:heme/copper-type cytochrome/quinol oxidase subunit 3